MKSRHLTILAVALVFAVSATADEPIATLDRGAVDLSWQPLVANSGTVLTISGPENITARYEFAAGEAPYFQIFDTEGYLLPDGAYTWELKAIPLLDDSSLRGLEAARAAGDDSYVATLRFQGKLPTEPMRQSGYFRVHGGSIVREGLEEVADGGGSAGVLRSQGAVGEGGGAPSTRDQVILDDLIVDGSICAGLDCVNGESFGFDTLRLKENNLRIKFQDTSASASFPSNDWQLTANDSTNGGANRFSIDDIDGGRTPFTIEASAPSHSLYVDSGGRIGLGTSNPIVETHIVSGDTPTLRLEQDGSSGFTPQIFDVAANEANFFVRDATNGSRLVLKIKPAAPTSSIFVAADGDIGNQTESPDSALHILRGASADASLHLEGGGGGTNLWVEETSTTAAARTLVNLTNNGGVRLAMLDSSSGGNQTWTVRNINAQFQLNDEVDADGVELRLRDNGNLEVTGSLTTAGGVTPDYVFEDDYDLLTLAEVAAFIDENGHLPNVPSAEEVKAKGSVNMTDFQNLLLEKIEELTLYTLQQQETIEALEGRLAEIEDGD